MARTVTSRLLAAGLTIGLTMVAALSAPPDACAQSQEGALTLLIRGGASVTTQDIALDVEAETGRVVSGAFVYGFNEHLALGLGVDLERRPMKSLDVELGEITTVSVMPFFELRPFGSGPLSPYAVVGAGVNLNSFDVDNEFQQGCIAAFAATCEFRLDDTVAFKAGGGFDIRFSEVVSLNLEASWKTNTGKQDMVVGGTTIVTDDDFKANSASVLVGLRFLFF